MKKSNKILAVVLALVMMLTAVPMMTAGAAADHVHKFVETVVSTADCNTEGKVTYTCTVAGCTLEKPFEINTEKTAHKFVGSVKAEDGNALEHKQMCDTCDKFIYTEHTFVETVKVAPTCDKEGKKDIKCSACNYAIKDISVPKVAHTYTTIAAGDINNDGHMGVCTVCNDTVFETHIWDNGVVTTAPKCVSTGVMKYTCTVCKKAVEAKNKATVDAVVSDAEKAAEDWNKIKSGNHTYNAWTSFSETQHIRECNCGVKDYEAHNFVVVAGEKSKCDDSVALTVTCKDCNYKLEAKATQHDFAPVAKYDENSHKQTCKKCNLTVTAPHVWKDVKEIEAATCGKVGSKEVKCNLCAEEATVEIPKLTEHTWGDWEVTKQPGFLTKGEETRKCDVCEKTETRKIDEIEEKVGDVNGNGKVQAVDARMILQHVAKTRELSAAELKRADIVGNGDGVKATDARKVLQIVAGLDK